MSNSSIKERISADLRHLETDENTCLQISEALIKNVAALENVPYDVICEGRELALQLQHAGWAIEEDCSPDIPNILKEVSMWLITIPE